MRRFTYAYPRSELAFKGTLADAGADPDGNIVLVIRRRHGADDIIRAARRARVMEWIFVLKHP
ncbi:MAG: hypothetical protein QW491_11935 [Thermoproteota archaeon]